MAKAKFFTNEEISNIIKLFQDGKSVREIRQFYHVRAEKIKSVLEENSVYENRRVSFYKTSEELATNRKYFCNFDYFKEIDTREKAYWLGFLFADGCILDRKDKKGNPKGKTLTFTLKEEDEYMLEAFRSCIKSNHPIRRKKVKLQDKIFIAYEFNIGSVKLCDDLISWGCVPRKSLILKYPNKLEDKYFGDFLRGYFDGDGCVSYTFGRGQSFPILLMDGTLEFLTAIKERLLSLNIKTGEILKDKRNQAYSIRISNQSFVNFYNLTYGTAEYHLGRKLDKFREILFDRNADFQISEIAKLARLIK
jgi:hypothetical protein